MRIEHISIWVEDLELMKAFYTKYFKMSSNKKYVNTTKQFSSYFLSLENGARIEIMHRPDVEKIVYDRGMTFGLTHFAITVGNKEKVDELTEQLRKDGYTIAGEPRITGDGYYESVVLDPEGNNIEITE